jgi:hypothetical protein
MKGKRYNIKENPTFFVLRKSNLPIYPSLYYLLPNLFSLVKS